MTDIVFPENTKQTMSILIDKGIRDQVELCTPIFSDLSLGEITKGTQIACDFPHVKGSIGLFHTHPIPAPASPTDFMSTISHGHEIICVGRQKDYVFNREGAIIGYSKEKIVSCFWFRKNELYNSLQKRARELNLRGANFENQLKKKYGYIPKRETELADDEYDQYRSILDGAEELEKEFEKNRNSLIENKITLEL